MKREPIEIGGIPALVWGEPSEKVYLCVHGKMGSKESADGIARIAAEKGYQTVSFDLPQHGQRAGEADRCDIWNGIRDLTAVAEYAFSRWKEVNLYACSLGAFFTLHACADYDFKKCLFQSPIVDMDYLIRQMMLWFGISEQRLAQEGEIDTPIDVLSWKYWQYVRNHPIENWGRATHILFAGRDDLQSLEVMEAFARRFGAELTVSENSCHPFMEEEDIPVVEDWLRKHILGGNEMKFETYTKQSFAVVGKEGSTEDGAGFVQRLWADANAHFAEVAALAKKDENGNLTGIWGAMTDFSRTFQPWEEDFSKGLYLAGVECDADAEPPEGWTKWTVPGFEYLRVECERDTVFAETLSYLQENGIPLAGAVQDFTCPRTGKNYMCFPVKRL